MRLTKPEPEVTDTLQNFANQRGIRAETLRKHGVGVRDDGWISIPYKTISGLVWHHKLRNPDRDGHPKYIYDRKGVEVHLYNPLGLGPNSDEVWFVEGELDALALIDIDVPAVAYPGVTTAVEWEGGDDEGRFKNEWFLLYEFAVVVAAGETDNKEAKAAVRAIQRQWRDRAYRFDPAAGGYKDVNDWLKADRDGLVAAVQEFRIENGLV